MNEIRVKNVKEVLINEDGILILQKDGGRISLSEEQLLNIIKKKNSGKNYEVQRKINVILKEVRNKQEGMFLNK